jgi:hypothetical protein
VKIRLFREDSWREKLRGGKARQEKPERKNDRSAGQHPMLPNVHNEGRAPLLRASLSIVLLGSFVIEPLAVLFA